MRIDFLIGVAVIGWITYSIIVIIYLSVIGRKYLTAAKRDYLIAGKALRGYESIIEGCKNKSSIDVLVLSGGGVRGQVPLHVLAYIEKCMGKKCGELFDFFAGCSTGAISVAGLSVLDSTGKYKFSAQDILDKYQVQSRQIFSSPWYHQIITLFGLFAPRFLPDNKNNVLTYYFDDLAIGELGSNILIPVYDIESNRLQIVRNWDTPHNDSNENFLVKDLVNGASSPPMIFPPAAFSVNGKEYLFIDPAVLLNNPILHIILYVRAVFPTKKLNVVILGNGGDLISKYDYRHMFSFGLYGLYQYLVKAPTLSSQLHMDFIEEYMKDTQRFDSNIQLFRVDALPNDTLAPLNTSERNMSKIRDFAGLMLQQNIDTINKIITILKK